MSATNDQDFSRAVWRTSSYSGNGNNCAEAASIGNHVAVRDTLNRAGFVGFFEAAAWRQFTEGLKQAQRSSWSLRPQPPITCTDTGQRGR